MIQASVFPQELACGFILKFHVWSPKLYVAQELA